MKRDEMYLGQPVHFKWDGLEADGIICNLQSSHIVVCLDKHNAGWDLCETDIDPSMREQCRGLRGWNVDVGRIQSRVTKKGNLL